MIENIKQSIENRKSVRTFESTEIAAEKLDAISELLTELNFDSTFADTFKIELINRTDLAENVKLGTYGMIKGANHFLVLTSRNDEKSLLQLGYAGEQLVLKIESLDLVSVWLGGSYSRKDFRNIIEFTADYELQLVIPFGIGSEKKRLINSFAVVISKNRLPIEKIAYIGRDLGDIRTLENAEIREGLELLRLAPSGANFQCWRVVVESDVLHFYTVKGLTPEVDLGIGFSHFKLWMDACGYRSEIIYKENSYLDNYKFSCQLTLN